MKKPDKYFYAYVEVDSGWDSDHKFFKILKKVRIRDGFFETSHARKFYIGDKGEIIKEVDSKIF